MKLCHLRTGLRHGTVSALLSVILLANAQAGLITDPNAPVNYQAQIGSANGVPLVNITAPSGAGVSHNQYQDFDVDQRGLIFNNSAKAGQSILGGSVSANPQFNGTPAKIILNEVTSTDTSTLEGVMEVFGDKANVIIANPNGVSCDGCGFINTHKATLTTGTPSYNNGRLDLEVRSGTIVIGERGLYGDEGNTKLSQIELVARRLEVNGEVVATDHLCALVGNLTYHYSFDGKSPNYTLLPGGVTTGEPLAIDASEFGALRAGNIQIMSTDTGAGVKLHGYLGTDAGDLFVKSAGDISVRNADGGNVTLNAAGDIDQKWKVHAEDSIHINAANYASEATSELTAKERLHVRTTQSQSHHGEVSSDRVELVAGQDIGLEGQAIGREWLTLHAGRDIQFKNLEVDTRVADIDAIGRFSMESSQLRTIEDLPVDVGNLDVDQDSSIDVVENDILINATGDIDSAGRIYANNLSVNTAGMTTNSGEISSAAALSLNTGGLSNQSNGSLQAQGELQLNVGAQGIQSLGQIQTEQELTISSAGNATLGGTVSGQTITADSQADLAVTGSFTSPGEVSITAQGQLSNSGAIASELDVNLTAGSVDNQAGGLISSQSVISANVTGLLANNGQLLTQQQLNLNAVSIDNQAQGLIESVLAMNVAVAGSIQNAGNWATQAVLTINADSLNSTAGTILADQDINLDVETISNAGALQTAKNLNINDAVTLSNSGTLASGEQLNIVNAQTLNNSGQVQANTLLAISAQILNNQVGGALEAQEGVQIDSGAMSNAGSVDTASELVINTNTLNNQIWGLLNADTSVSITAAQQIDNAGDIGTGNILNITTNTLNNEVSGRVVSKGISTHDINGQLNNSGQIGSLTDFVISSTNLTNNAGGVILAQDNLNITVQAGLSNHGTIRANNVAADSTTTISAATLANDGGANTQSALIYGANNLSLSTSSSLYNRGEILSGKDLVDTGDIQLTATGSVNNAGGFIQAGKMVFDGAHSLTNAATIRALDVVQLSGTSLTNTSTGLIYTANTTQAGTTDKGLVKLDYTGTLSNQGRIVSAADVDIRASSITNNRIMAAGNTLKVDAYAGSLNNVTPTGGAQATLFAGGKQDGGLDLDASGNILNNFGNIEARGSGDSAINAGGTFTNLSRGTRTEAFQRQYADHNYAYSNYNADHLWHVNTLNLDTYEGAPVYTNAAQVYVQGDLTVSAASVVNSASLIESGGNMTLSGQVSNNSSTYQADHYREYMYTEWRRLGTSDAQFQAETVARYDKVTAAYQNNLNILRDLYQQGNLSGFGNYDLNTSNWNSIIEGDVNASMVGVRADGIGVNNYFYNIKVGDASATAYAHRYTQQALLSEIATLQAKVAGRTSAAREDVRQEAFYWGKVLAPDGNFNVDPAFLDNFNSANFTNRYGAQDKKFHIKTSTGHTFEFGTDTRKYTRTNLGKVNLVGTQGNIVSGRNLAIYSTAGSTNGGVIQANVALYVGAGALAATNADSGQGSVKSTNQLTSLQGNVSAANAAAVQTIDVSDETDSAFTNGYADQDITVGTPSTPDPIIDLSQYITDANASGSSVFDLLNNPSSAVTGNASSLAASIFQPVTPLSVSSTAKELREVLAPNGNFFIDPFREAQILRQAALIQTGTSFFSRTWKTQQEQEEGLYSNAIEFAKNYKLDIGQVVDEQLLANLTEPMIWYHEREINGETKLVPQVYLPRVSIADLHIGNGGTIVAESAEFNLDKDFSNTGNISTTGDLTVKAENIFNSVRITQHEDSANSAHTSVGGGGNIKAGALTLQASNDIRSVGGNISGSESVRLQAGNDISLESAEEISRHSLLADGVEIKTSSLVNHVTQINAGEAGLSLSAGSDVTAEGTQFNSDGSAILKAGGSINLLAVQDEESRYGKGSSKGFASKKSTTMEESSRTNKGVNLTAKGNLGLLAGNDINLLAAALQADGKGAVKAGGSISLVAAVDTEKERITEQKSNAVKFKNTDKGSISQTAAVSSITTGDDLSFEAGGDMNVLGSHIASDQTIRIGSVQLAKGLDGRPQMDENGNYVTESGKSVQNLNIGTIELTNEDWHEVQKGLKGPLKEFAKAMAFVGGIVVPGLEFELKVGEGSSDRTTSTTNASSSVSGQNLLVNAEETVRLAGAAVNIEDTAFVNAENIEIDAVANRTRTEHSEYEESVKGLGQEVGEDEVRVAGIEEKKHTESTITQETNWQGSTINATNLTLNATNNISILASDIETTEDAEILAGNQVTVGGRKDTKEVVHEEKTETKTTSIAVKNAYLDVALAIKALNEALKSARRAKNALSEAKQKVKDGKLAASDLKYYEANLAAAGYALHSSRQAVAGSMGAAVTAASTSLGTGFYASGKAEHKTYTKTETTNSSTWNGSSIVAGGNATLSGKNTLNIEGSDLFVTEGLVLNGDEINITAGVEEETTKTKEREKTKTASFSANAAGPTSFSVGLSQNNTDADSYRKTHINSQIQAGSLTSNSTTLNIAGANLLADDIDITTETLTVASLQDEERSQSKTRGSSVGMGFSGSGAPSSVNGGINRADSKSSQLWTNQQTTILGSNSVSIRAKDTTLTGAVIANATQNEDGSLTDQGNLDFETQTLAVNDLMDIDESKNTSFNLNVSHNLAGDKGSKEDPNEPGKDPNRGSTTIGGSNNGHSKEQITRASLGGGAIRIGGQDKVSSELAALGINTDLSQAQETTKDMQTGGLDASVTVDHRLFSEAGRGEMKAERQDAYNQGKNLGRAATQAIGTEETFIGRLKQFAANKRAIEKAHADQQIQEALNKNGDADTKLAGSQGLADGLAAESNVDSAEVALYDGKQTHDDSVMQNKGDVNKQYVEGAYDEQGKRIFINTDATNMTDGVHIAKVVSHESARNRMGQEGGTRDGALETRIARSEGNSAGEVWEALNTRKGIKTGDAAGYSQQTWNQNNNNSKTVKAGTKTIASIDSKDLKARQLVNAERRFIREKAADYAVKRGFCASEGECSQADKDKAASELARKAVQKTDLLHKLTQDGTETEGDLFAEEYLANVGDTFINENGEEQQLFTTQGDQFRSHGENLQDAGLDKEFYSQYVNGTATRTAGQGLKEETVKLGNLAADKTGELAQYIADNPEEAARRTKDAAVKAGQYVGGKVVEGYDAVMEDPSIIATKTGEALESAWEGTKRLFNDTGGRTAENIAIATDDGLSQTMDSIYGQDMSDASKTVAAADGLFVLGEVAGVGALVKQVGTKGASAIAKQVGKGKDKGIDLPTTSKGDSGDLSEGGKNDVDSGPENPFVEVEPEINTKMSPERRAELNEKFDRTGNLNDDINIRGRQETATNFYKGQGVDEVDIPSHTGGIDFTKDVDVVTINKGKELKQFQTEGAPQGNYYAPDPDITPSELGISPDGFNRTTKQIEPKNQTTYVTDKKVKVLKSTASPIEDTWSVPGENTSTQGGGKQYFSGEKDAFKPKSDLPPGYHEKIVNGKKVVSRNKGKAQGENALPKLSRTDEGNLYSPVKVKSNSKAQGVKNKSDGTKREERVQKKLEGKFKGSSVQREQTLLDMNGKKVVGRDGTGRKIDHVVIKDGKVTHSIETTSKTTNKVQQSAKEANIRAKGGNFIRDRETGDLVDMPKDVETRIIRVK